MRRFKKILIPAGFEPAPPKRSGPRPDALDHSARVPIHLLDKGLKQTQFIKERYAIEVKLCKIKSITAEHDLLKPI